MDVSIPLRFDLNSIRESVEEALPGFHPATVRFESRREEERRRREVSIPLRFDLNRKAGLLSSVPRVSIPLRFDLNGIRSRRSA